MKKGFTLLESMIALFISTVIVAALFITMSAGRRNWYEADAQLNLQQDLRRATITIMNDLRQSGSAQISCPANGVPCPSVAFNISRGALISGIINWSAAPVNYSLSSGQVLRAEGGVTRVIANNITALSFTRNAASAGIVQINISGQRATPFGRVMNATLNFEAALRN